MKTHIWNRTKAFPSKVNFIDSNNVILGYDLGQSCCENAFWTISESSDGSNPIYRGDDSVIQEIELDGYCFDPNFCQVQEPPKPLSSQYEDAYVAMFKLVGLKYPTPEKPDLFLRLENHHNGYYSHGFTFRGDVIVNEAL